MGFDRCSHFGEAALELLPTIEYMANHDPNNMVRSRAGEYLGLTGDQKAIDLLQHCFEAAQAITEANMILNSMTLLKDLNSTWTFKINEEIIPEAWINDRASHLKQRLIYLAE